MPLDYEEKQEASKKIILLLLEGSEKPVKTLVHFQKELFLLTVSFRKLNELLDFKSSNYGVYSDIANSVLENNVGEVFDITPKGIAINEKGRKQATETLNEMNAEKKEKMMRTIRIIRSLYDRLTAEELEFLIYEAYGYKEKSLDYKKLDAHRAELSCQLLRKGAISKQRYHELLGETFETCT